MANYENIKPYSELVHTASLFGGPQKYLQQQVQTYFNMGVQHEKSTEGWKGAILVGIAIGVWELGKAGIRLLQDKHRDKMKNERQKSEQASMQLQSGGASVHEENQSRRDDSYE